MQTCSMDIRRQLKDLQLSAVTDVGRELGCGAYGVVREVKVNGLHCAAKQLHQVLLETGHERVIRGFVDECRQHSRQRHPNIVQLLGVYFPSPHAELPQMVLELMEMTLSKCLEKYPSRLPLSLKNDMLMDVAQGLVHLHSQDPPIIHRDLTANNVLVTKHLVAKISDLGVSKLIDVSFPHLSCELTRQPGTIAYMPPEALSNTPSYNTKLDIFSFGVLIIHVCTEKRPIPTSEFVQVSNNDDMPLYHRVTEVERRSDYLAEMGKDHQHIELVRQCLQDKPESRLCSEEVLTCLQSISTTIGHYPSRLELMQAPTPRQLSSSSSSKDTTDGSGDQPLSDSMVSPTTSSQSNLPTGESRYNSSSLKRRAGIYKSESSASLTRVIRKLSASGEETIKNITVVGLYKHTTQFAKSLEFDKGDMLQILSKSGDAKWLARSQKSGKEGYILSCYVVPVEWYFGKLKPSEAQKKLLQTGNETGTFLIRESEDHPGSFSLSVRFRKSVRHYSIRKTSRDCFYISPRSMYSTIEGLIRHYMSSSDGLCCQLTDPCPKNELPAMYQWEIERSQITLSKVNVGEMSEGFWRGSIPVGVKVQDKATMSRQQFIAVANIMKTLHHENLIQLYGVCMSETMLIVTEFMKYGCLIDYLQKPGKGCDLRMPMLTDIARQIASGMAYLEAQSYIHRDLAARNVQVLEGSRVKIADFSVTVHVSDASSYTLTPTKWTAPEAIKYNQFSFKSDVWSFGILLTELVTRGGIPYPGKSTEEVLAILEQGYRMKCPPKCSEPLYQIMLDCWKEDPSDRPTFEQLKLAFRDF